MIGRFGACDGYDIYAWVECAICAQHRTSHGRLTGDEFLCGYRQWHVATLGEYNPFIVWAHTG